VIIPLATGIVVVELIFNPIIRQQKEYTHMII